LAYVVQMYMLCLSKNRLDTELLRIHLFSVFTIKRLRALAVIAPLGFLILKTLTNVLLLGKYEFVSLGFKLLMSLCVWFIIYVLYQFAEISRDLSVLVFLWKVSCR